jgi:hypothetical protein
MTYAEYLHHSQQLLFGPDYPHPYENPAYLEYARLGLSRMKRWDKSMILDASLKNYIRAIDQPQTWVVITEPWCGDAAPMLPFIARLADENPLITLDIQLRDQPPFLIEHYLTNGGKSIPKLIVRDADGKDLFTWGPRPALAQQLVLDLNASGAEKSEVVLALQNWYNDNKGEEMQQEWMRIFQTSLASATIK